MLLPTAVVLLQLAAAASAISGTVRDGTAGRPLAGVQITEGGRPAAVSDTAGRYAIPGLPGGSHQLRFVLAGYRSLVLGVLLPDSAESRVDVQLESEPVRLATLQVLAAGGSPPSDRPDEVAELGRVRVDQHWLDLRQAGEGDVYRALADEPGIRGTGEAAAALHVRGGGASENLVLLDGIPLFSAAHFAGSSSAVNPDVVAGAELHAGVSSARFGDHLAGVVELETRDPGPGPLEGRGSLGAGELRQALSGFVPGTGAGVLIGARTTYHDALVGESYGAGGNGYQDLIGVATAQTGKGRLRVVSFLADNRLAFPALGDGAGARSGAADGEYTGGLRNSIAWRSFSQGVTWSRSDTRAKIESAAWWAGSSADVSWGAGDGTRRMRSNLSELGLSARVSWPAAGGGVSLGGSLVRPATRYTVESAPLALSAAPLVGSVFAERQWRPAPALLVSAGLRAGTDFASWAGVEPRLTAVLEPDARTRLGLGAGRSHQVLQSVLNDESALGPLLGFDLPAAAGGAVPVARADQLEALVSRRLGGGLEFSVTGYLRRTAGVVLGAASTRGLFPADSIVLGEGGASGLSGALAFARGPVSARAALTVARDERRAGATRYDASYGHGTSLNFDLGYRLPEDTRLQLRFRGGAQQPTSVVGPGFEWQPMQPFRESGELAGTPESLSGAINAARLPAYARIDLGVRREWHLPGVGRGTVLTTAVSVANLLDRENVLGLVTRPDGTLRPIRGIARSLVLEAGWRF